MRITRDATGVLRCVTDGHSYRVHERIHERIHAKGCSYHIVQKGLQVSCTRAVRAFLKAPAGGTGPLSTLPSASMDAIWSKVAPADRKAVSETSRTMNTAVKMFHRRLAEIARAPMPLYRQQIERLTPNELMTLEDYLADNAPPFPFGQHDDELVNAANMEAFQEASRKMELIEAVLRPPPVRLAVLRPPPVR